MSAEKVLKAVQRHIPIVRRPFRAIGDAVELTEEEVISILKSFKEEGIIRQISPIYDPKRAGYDSALVAFRVKAEDLERTAGRVSSCPGVSHCYERHHSFNLWFTLAVPQDSLLTLEGVVSLLAGEGVEEVLILRARRTFKIGVYLSFRSMYEREEVQAPSEDPEPVPLTPLEREVVRATQESIPLVPEPFRLIAENIGLEETLLLEVLRGLKGKGVMRRFSAVLRHRKAGFTANGMVVWRVPEEKLGNVGMFLAGFRCVSHCYERAGWDYNLFSMVHGRSREEVEDFVRRVGEEVGVREYEILFSGREFLKRRIKIFTEDFYEWERREMGACAYEGEDSEGSGKTLLQEGF